MRVLVTGILGFIGSNLAEKLVANGYDVYGVIRRVANRNMNVIENIIGDVTLISGDITDYVSTRNAIKTANPDVVVHLAALSPVRDSFERPFEYQQTNFVGTMNVAHSLLELPDSNKRKLIAASTAEVYGIQKNEPLKETLPLHPSSPYAVSKAAGDIYLQMPTGRECPREDGYFSPDDGQPPCQPMVGGLSRERLGLRCARARSGPCTKRCTRAPRAPYIMKR